MHRLVVVLADLGSVEDAVVLHYRLATEDSLIWAGDDPGSAMATARATLGDERISELGAIANRMPRHELIPWLTDAVARAVDDDR